MTHPACIVIDGIQFTVPVISIERTANSLFKYAERTENGELKAERIGWYWNYRIQIGLEFDSDVYETLWNKLTEPAEFHVVSLPDTKGMTLPYEVYFAEVSDVLLRFRGINHTWQGLQFEVIARKPHR